LHEAKKAWRDKNQGSEIPTNGGGTQSVLQKRIDEARELTKGESSSQQATEESCPEGGNNELQMVSSIEQGGEV